MTDGYIQTINFIPNNKNRILCVETALPDTPSDVWLMGHGYGGDHNRPYMQVFKQACRTMNQGYIAFDMTGCGMSDGKLGNLTRKNAKNDWLTVMDYAGHHSGIDPCRIKAFGCSYGANALIEATAERNRAKEKMRLQELMLLVPVPKWKKVIEFALQAKVMLSGKDLKKIDEDHALPILLGDLELHVSHPFIKQLKEMDLYDDVAHIDQPTTIIGAEFDELVAPSKLWKLQKKFPGKTPVRVEILKGAHHSLNDVELQQFGILALEMLKRSNPDHPTAKTVLEQANAGQVSTQPTPYLRAI